MITVITSRSRNSSTMLAATPAVAAHDNVIAQSLKPFHQTHHPLHAALDNRAQRHRQRRDEQRHADEEHRHHEPLGIAADRIDLGDIVVVAQGNVCYQSEVRGVGPAVDAVELVPSR